MFGKLRSKIHLPRRTKKVRVTGPAAQYRVTEELATGPVVFAADGTYSTAPVVVIVGGEPAAEPAGPTLRDRLSDTFVSHAAAKVSNVLHRAVTGFVRGFMAVVRFPLKIVVSLVLGAASGLYAFGVSVMLVFRGKGKTAEFLSGADIAADLRPAA